MADIPEGFRPMTNSRGGHHRASDGVCLRQVQECNATRQGKVKVGVWYAEHQDGRRTATWPTPAEAVTELDSTPVPDP